MPQTRIYSLYVPFEEEAVYSDTETSIVITTDSKRYLKQPYIAQRNSEYELVISKYSKWEMSPKKMLSVKLKEALSSSGIFKSVRVSSYIPKGFYSLKINLKEFERYDGREGSQGVLLFDITLLAPDNSELYRDTVSKKAELSDSSFSSLSKALSIALKQGIEEIMPGILRAVKENENKG